MESGRWEEHPPPLSDNCQQQQNCVFVCVCGGGGKMVKSSAVGRIYISKPHCLLQQNFEQITGKALAKTNILGFWKLGMGCSTSISSNWGHFKYGCLVGSQRKPKIAVVESSIKRLKTYFWMGPSVKSISNMQDSIPNNKHVCKIFFRDMYTLAHFFFRGVQFSSFLVYLGH